MVNGKRKNSQQEKYDISGELHAISEISYIMSFNNYLQRNYR